MEFKATKKQLFGTTAGLMLLVLGVMLLVPSVSAVDFSVITAAKGIAPTFSMTMDPGAVNLGLMAVGMNDKDGNIVAITSNTPFQVKAKDRMIASKIPAHAGKMAAFWDPNYAANLDEGLTNPLLLKLNGGSYTGFTATDTVIYAGVAGAFSEPLKIRQEVLVTDKILPDPIPYKIDIMITGAPV